ncbi:MAG: hypothetical protein EB084_10080 [Proteobacteria bacterium]|nr:hypothetical protein [Pseudomonadota bacterium]
MRVTRLPFQRYSSVWAYAPRMMARIDGMPPQSTRGLSARPDAAKPSRVPGDTRPTLVGDRADLSSPPLELLSAQQTLAGRVRPERLTDALTCALARVPLLSNRIGYSYVAEACPPDMPLPLWTALHQNADDARRHLAEIEKLGCSAEQKARIVAAYPQVLKRGQSETVLQVLTTLSTAPEAGRLFERFAEQCDRRDIVAAQRDLRIALSASSTRGISVDQVYIATEKAHVIDQPIGGWRRYNETDFQAAVALLLDAPDTTEQDERARDLAAAAGPIYIKSAIELARALTETRSQGPERALIRDLCRRHLALENHTINAEDLMRAIAAIDVPGEVAGRAADLETLVATSGRLHLATFDLVLASRPSNGCPREDAVGYLKTLRERDPARTDRYAQFADPSAALDYILHGLPSTGAPTDPTNASARLEQLLSLQGGKRNVGRALELESAIARLGCDEPQKAQIRNALSSRLESLSESGDGAIVSALQACGAPDARARFAAFERFLDITRRPGVATASMTCSIAASNRSGVPLEETVDHLSALRESDPALRDRYAVYANAEQALAEILSGPTPTARRAIREALIGLQGDGRNADVVTPVLHALRAAAPGETAQAVLLPVLKKQLDTHGLANAPQLIDALALAAAAASEHGGDVATRYAQFGTRLAQVKRPSVAVKDFKHAAQAASAAHVPLEVALEAVRTLRDADPALSDRYATPDSLEAPLQAVIGAGASAEEVANAVRRLVALQANQRTPSDALPHELALRALPCDESEREQVRVAYRALLEKIASSQDKSLLEMLTAATTHGAPMQVVSGFARLFEMTARPAIAVGDLKQAIALVRPGLGLDEAVSTICALRENDPARSDRYATFSTVTAAASHALSAPTAADRDQCLARVTALQRLWPDLDQAATFDARIEGLQLAPEVRDAVRASFTALLKSENMQRYSNRPAETLNKLLDTVGNEAEAPALVAAFASLLEVAQGGSEALSDLVSVIGAVRRRSLPIADVTALAKTIRQGARQQGYGSDLDMAGPIELAAKGPSEADRSARAVSLAALVEKMSSSSACARLEWILESPTAPAADLTDATRKMIALSRLKGDDGVRAIYDRLQKKAATEHPSWWQKLLRLSKPYERTVWIVSALSQNASAVDKVLDALDEAALPGESHHQTLKRFHSLLATERRGVDDATLASVTEVFRGSLRSLPFADEAPAACWKRFNAVAQQLPLWALPAVWKSAAAAVTLHEHQARLRAWSEIATVCGTDASRVYQALTESLSPTDAIDAALPQMLALLKKAKPDLVAVTWRLQRELTDLSAGDRAAALTVLERAQFGEQAQALFEQMRDSVGDEPISLRISTLKTLLDVTRNPQQALAHYQQMKTDLQSDFASCAGPYATLCSLLAVRSKEAMKTASELLRTARQLQAEGLAALPDLPPTPISEMLLGLTQSMVLGGDVEQAAHALRNAEQQRRKAAMHEGKGGRVEVGDGEINVGGIRIKRKPTA